MKPDRKAKKSDTVKFRVPWTLKRDFMARARDEGRPASDIFREFMEDYLRQPAQRATQTLETAMTAIRKRPRTSAGAAAIIAAAAISAVLSGALPAGAESDMQAVFEGLDANGDGIVTAEEMWRPPVNTAIRRVWRPGPESAPQPPSPEDTRISAFNQFDEDGDGGLSLEEFAARHEARVDSLFASFDRNGDGAINLPDETVSEPVDALGRPTAGYALDMTATLRPVDTDGDGRITREEWEVVVPPRVSTVF